MKRKTNRPSFDQQAFSDAPSVPENPSDVVFLLPSASEELASTRLPDARLRRRLGRIADALAEAPDASFPKAAGSVAALEATYRFFNNDAVEPEQILAAHRSATLARMPLAGEVLVVHDTTSLEFRGEAVREGLGRLRSGGQGFFSHVALAVTADDARRPLGVLAHGVRVRLGPARGKRSHKELMADPDNESKRWRESIDAAETANDGRASLIHIMDREADAYPLMTSLCQRGVRFVVRASRDRVTSVPADGGPKRAKVSDATSEADIVATRDVPISKRKDGSTPSSRKTHPPRQYRTARLVFRAAITELVRPNYLPSDVHPTLRVNVVQVDEIDVGPGLTPVRWTLYTNEPIETPQDILRVVDLYRARWTIEEYFKALKQGCAFESRQLDTLKSLLVALAIFIPIAWRLLLLRSLGRFDDQTPATDVLSESQVEVLVATSKGKLIGHPTVRQAMLAIAARGGHIPSNGEPGWMVLGRGFHDLLLLEAGWIAARNAAPP